MCLRGVVVVLQAEGEIVVVLVGVGALGDLADVILIRSVAVGAVSGMGGVRGQVGVVVRVVGLQLNKV